jgi:hypothetical protein
MPGPKITQLPKYILDAAESYYQFDLLPPNDNVGSGLLVNKYRTKFIPIQAPKTVSMLNANTKEATLQEDGSLSVVTTLRYEGYRNILYRRLHAQSEDGEQFIMDHVLDNFTDISLDSFEIFIDEQNKSNPMVVSLEYRIDHFADVIGDKIYFSPALLHRLTENVFQREKRTYPIDYNYPRINLENVIFTLPAGYEVIELPENVRYSIRGHQFDRVTQLKSDRLHYSRQLYISETLYDPSYYETIQEFYAAIVNTDQDQIILIKKDE